MLIGKIMKPSVGMKKTILMGDCMCKAYKDNPAIGEVIPMKGCPPSPKAAKKALERAGIAFDPSLLLSEDQVLSSWSKRYEGRPGLDESFFRVLQ